MKIVSLKIALFIALAITFGASPCLAKADGYFFVVAYSYKDKVIYCSSVFSEKVSETSYNDEQYVTDVELLRKIESAFGEYMTQVAKVDMTQYTISYRGAYKNRSIAMKYLEAEKKEHRNKGMVVKVASTFKFNN